MFQSATVTYLKSKNSSVIKKQLNCSRKKVILNKTRVVNCKSERIILVKKTQNISESISPKYLQSSVRRETFSIGEKENLPILKKKIFGQDLTDFDHSFKRKDKKCHDHIFNNHFDFENQNDKSIILSDDSLDDPPKTMGINNSAFNDFCFTPLKSYENILSPFSTSKQFKSFEQTDVNLGFTSITTSPFQPKTASTVAKDHTPEKKKLATRISVNLFNTYKIMSKDEYCTTWTANTLNAETTTPENNKSIDQFRTNNLWMFSPLTYHSSKITICLYKTLDNKSLTFCIL